MHAADGRRPTDPEAPTHPAEFVVMDDENGVLVVLVASDRDAPTELARLLVFLGDGRTLWFDAEAADRRASLEWTQSRRAHYLRLFALTATDRAPAEHLAGLDGDSRNRFSVPVALELTLEPESPPVTGPSGGTDIDDARHYRVTGSLAAGSVVFAIEGRGWAGRQESDTGAPEVPEDPEDPEDQVRLRAAFQDRSGIVATWRGRAGSDDRAGRAAKQDLTRSTRMSVSALRVDGPARGVPRRLICQLDGDPALTVFGGRRSLDQHVAFVRERTDGRGWIRRAFTPFDFVCSGVTGFGVLEQVERVASPDAPEFADEIPNPGL